MQWCDGMTYELYRTGDYHCDYPSLSVTLKSHIHSSTLDGVIMTGHIPVNINTLIVTWIQQLVIEGKNLCGSVKFHCIYKYHIVQSVGRGKLIADPTQHNNLPLEN